eukprot:GGOE01006546.1.p2 GENE.GGOE01006546.1~~GGOE01006546.1.p2  ORF type:complete len:119 (-),score=3.11 GGOE01006546.1:173-529(-)
MVDHHANLSCFPLILGARRIHPPFPSPPHPKLPPPTLSDYERPHLPAAPLHGGWLPSAAKTFLQWRCCYFAPLSLSPICVPLSFPGLCALSCVSPQWPLTSLLPCLSAGPSQLRHREQ